MRIIASISLLLLLLFNLGGYRIVMDYLQDQHNSRLEAQLDNRQYDESHLIEIRVPVSLPYQTDWKSFERVDGEVFYNGLHYKFVERKLQGGEMIYKCIPNTTKAELVNARENFFRLVNDLETQESSATKSAPRAPVKSFSFDCCDELQLWSLSSLPRLSVAHPVYKVSFFATQFISGPAQPPEA